MSAAGLVSCGTLSSSTMMVMMIAMTPSLNASKRVLVIPSFSLSGFEDADNLPLGFAVLHFVGRSGLHFDTLAGFG